MTSLRFTVDVEVSRESGLFASRDEISEKVLEAIESSVQDADLTGLGNNGDSEYTVDGVMVDEIDNKQLRKLWEENDRRAPADAPSEAQRKVRALSKEVRDKTAEIHRLLETIDKLREERAGEPTRIFASEGYGGDKLYLPDSTIDRVNFVVDETEHERDIISVTHRGEEGIEVRYENMGRNVLAVLPQSGNVLRLVVVPR